VRTTPLPPGLPVYPHLGPQLVVSGRAQLWSAAITYIRLLWEFGYLAVSLVVGSRRCMGWARACPLEAELTRAAVHMALATRAVRPGLVHHSDPGGQ
jgi:transposase InsO family protein